MVRCDNPFSHQDWQFTPPNGNTIKKNTCFQMHCLFFFIYHVCVGFILMTRWYQTSATDHLITFYPQIHVQPLPTARVGVASRMRKLASIRLVEAPPPPVAVFPVTHTNTLQQESVMNTRSRQVSQRIYLTDTFPNHVSKKKKKTSFAVRVV